MSEQVGKHKGAVETLLHEKKELSRILSIVNGQLERHLNALEEAGVDTDQFISDLQQQSQQRQKQAQQQQERQRERRQSQGQGNKRQQSSGSKPQEQEKDVDDMLESEDRDFNPL
ncbi:MAG: hypothetical protein ABEJ72_09415 [Candidatus Aenigmatarchaeota archaeon]